LATKYTPKPEHLALLMSHLTKHNGIAMVKECERLYSPELVAYALKHNKVQPTIIAAKCQYNLMPIQKINAIMTPEWKRDRPIWLDTYLASLRKQMGISLPQDTCPPEGQGT